MPITKKELITENYLILINALEEFIDNLQQKDLEKFKDFFDKMPEIKKDVKFKCPKCDYEEDITIKGMQNFFV